MWQRIKNIVAKYLRFYTGEKCTKTRQLLLNKKSYSYFHCLTHTALILQFVIFVSLSFQPVHIMRETFKTVKYWILPWKCYWHLWQSATQKSWFRIVDQAHCFFWPSLKLLSPAFLPLLVSTVSTSLFESPEPFSSFSLSCVPSGFKVRNKYVEKATETRVAHP